MAENESRLVPYALGTLDEEERAEVERDLAASSSLRLEMNDIIETLGEFADAQRPMEPSSELRSTLLTSISKQKPFEGLLDRVSQFVDLGADRVREIFDMALDKDSDAWSPSPFPSTKLLHFSGGPRVVSADCGLVWLEPNAEFPAHRHLGDEWAMVMQGGIREHDGTIFRYGDVSYREAGSQHSFVSIGPEPLIFVVVLHDGLKLI